MKTVRELQTALRFYPQEINSSVEYFTKNCKIDFDVYLPSRGMNLQRDFVWSIEQKRELIWSVLIRRNIPRMAMVNIVSDNKDISGTYQVIDGKQRLSTMIDFYNDKFNLIIDDKSYLFSELPTDYQSAVSKYMFPYYLVCEEYPNQITDEDKITWFKYINYSGTPQDKKHMDTL